MYTAFYGLQQKPFETVPDPAFFFLSRQHREILASLLYGLQYNKGVILVAGDIGTGKTTLINVLLQELGDDWLPISIINPKISFADLLSFISKKLQLPLNDQHSLLDRCDVLRQYLSDLYTQGKRVVLIIDEAHLLDQDALEDIRLLSNIEDQGMKLIQIILVGQNEIFPLLDRERSRPLYQRMTIIRKLDAFSPGETKAYIEHRLKAAGGSGDIFLTGAQQLIAKKSGGIPRIINQICDNALLIGYALGKRHIGKKIIREVLSDMTPHKPLPGILSAKHKKTVMSSGLMAALAVLVLVYMVMSGRFASNRVFDAANKTKTQKQAAPQVILHTTGQHSKNKLINNGSPVPDNELSSSPERHDNDTGSPVRVKDKPNNIKTGDSSRLINIPEKIPGTINMHNLEEGQQVKVGVNQWLYKLCRQKYGLASELLVDLIHMANPQIKNVNFVYPGQKIILPELTKEDLLVKDRHGLFHIHYASFYRFKKAETVLDKLIGNGYEAFMIPNLQGENTVFRIYIGIFKNRTQGLQELQKLELPFFVSRHHDQDLANSLDKSVTNSSSQ